MSEPADPGTGPEPQGDRRLMVLLAMAMFVLVVDTSHGAAYRIAIDRVAKAMVKRGAQ